MILSQTYIKEQINRSFRHDTMDKCDIFPHSIRYYIWGEIYINIHNQMATGSRTILK